MNITIITVGKNNERCIQQLIDEYSGRIKAKLNWIMIPNQNMASNASQTKLKETAIIIKKLESINDSYKILLDEKGNMIKSEQLSHIIEQTKIDSKNLVFVIGGAYGVEPELHQKVDFIWSLSNLVFPHRLVRLILAEQIYRAMSISSGSKYHHA
ncbi:MAG TPA: 23S rRNA (pseudouridine(1915)-N(3))-methyltransferase RlmH [Candidatus Saccharibacteria bacterium]|nr:23S rRNA (pseudouridine(1915)-N(3))-methyltransferase RlmH [Candidatus Saccharibacteria bacterium]